MKIISQTTREHFVKGGCRLVQIACYIALAFYVFVFTTLVFAIKTGTDARLQPIPDMASACNILLLAVAPTVISNITLLVAVIGIFTAWVLWHGESYLYRLLYPAYTNDIPLEVVFRWQIMAVVLLALPMVTLFFTGITQRFGTKGFGVLWLLLWGGCMLIPAAVGSAADGGTSLLARMGGGVLWLAGILPPLAWACMGAAVLIAAAVAGILCLCTAEVKL